MLSIFLFGALRMQGDGRPVRFAPPRRAAALLAYLLLKPGQPIDRASLAFTLWPDSTEDEARASLRRHLYLLQHALPPPAGEPWLSITASTVGWNPAAPAGCDVDWFRAALTDERRYDEAAALYAGDLLEGFEDEWVLDERERLRQRHIENLERLVQLRRGEARNGDALRLAQELLRLDPWREDAVRQIMALRQAAGDRAGALAEFERFSRRLREELDVDPMAETVALYGDLVRNAAPIATVAGEPVAAVAGEAAAAIPFVGRAAPLRKLGEIWSRGVRGRGSLVLIGGEAGAGKTRLVDEVAARARAVG
ncbi:MAG: BTAD domain-containing putative transcriptional regulator, partial [Vulcanimicrobiaceae bacterium]